MSRYREGELTLDQLMAFTLTDDHGRQEEVGAALMEQEPGDDPQALDPKPCEPVRPPRTIRRRRSASKPAASFFAISSSKTTAATTPTASSSTAWSSRSSRTRRGGIAGEAGSGSRCIRNTRTTSSTPCVASTRTPCLSPERRTKLDELVTRHDALIAEHGEDAPDDVGPSSTAWPKRSLPSSGAPKHISWRIYLEPVRSSL